MVVVQTGAEIDAIARRGLVVQIDGELLRRPEGQACEPDIAMQLARFEIAGLAEFSGEHGGIPPDAPVTAAQRNARCSFQKAVRLLLVVVDELAVAQSGDGGLRGTEPLHYQRRCRSVKTIGGPGLDDAQPAPGTQLESGIDAHVRLIGGASPESLLRAIEE